MSFEDDNYERGAEITYRIVRDWRGEVPRFRFPPKDVALLADLRDVGLQLAANAAARELVALLIKRCVERTGRAPTSMMLLVVLEKVGIPVEHVPLEDLKLSGQLKTIPNRRRN